MLDTTLEMNELFLHFDTQITIRGCFEGSMYIHGQNFLTSEG